MFVSPFLKADPVLLGLTSLHVYTLTFAFYWYSEIACFSHYFSCNHLVFFHEYNIFKIYMLFLFLI